MMIDGGLYSLFEHYQPSDLGLVRFLIVDDIRATRALHDFV